VSEEREAMAAGLRRLADEMRRVAAETDDMAANLEGQPEGSGTVVSLASRSEPDYGAVARRMLKDRRKVAEFFEPDMFADPARDILLDLFAAAEEGENVSVSSCCIAAAVPPTTALRWLDRLKQIGLVEQSEDESDRRRKFVKLTVTGRDAMRRYLASISRVPPPVAA
jgi:DNA-binding transcriptional ArsR family regulator